MMMKEEESSEAKDKSGESSDTEEPVSLKMMKSYAKVVSH